MQTSLQNGKLLTLAPDRFCLFHLLIDGAGNSLYLRVAGLRGAFIRSAHLLSFTPRAPSRRVFKSFCFESGFGDNGKSHFLFCLTLSRPRSKGFKIAGGCAQRKTLALRKLEKLMTNR